MICRALPAGTLTNLRVNQKPLRNRIVDAEHAQMCRAIREDRTPNLLLMHYDLASWHVSSLILIPRFALSLTAIERRRPLGPSARRAGWVGCNILLRNIPIDARLSLIENGKPADPALIRRLYRRIKRLSTIRPETRGWTLDVLTAIRSLQKNSFTLDDAYGLEYRLAELHPANRHVRDKIRQQLQVLRDAGLLDFVGRGTYQLRP